MSHDYVVKCYIHNITSEGRRVEHYKSMIECTSYMDANLIRKALAEFREIEMLVRIKTLTGTLLIPLETLQEVAEEINKEISDEIPLPAKRAV